MDPAFENTKLWAKQTLLYVTAVNPDEGMIEDQARARPRVAGVFDQMLAAVEVETQSQPEARSTAMIVRVLDWVAANHRPSPPGQ